MKVYIIMYIDGYYPDAVCGDVVYSSREKAEVARQVMYDQEIQRLYDEYFQYGGFDEYQGWKPRIPSKEYWMKNHQIQEWRVK